MTTEVERRYELKCKRCGREWLRANLLKLPRQCPDCGTRHWDEELNPKPKPDTK